MNPNNVVSFVSRMPFSGICHVRPAALRGALAARRGDVATVAQSCDRIREVSHVNVLFAAMGGAVLAANTYYSFKTGSVIGCAAHSAEATVAGLMLAGHSMSAYAQHVISDRIERIAVSTPPAEAVPAQAYPDFPTQAPAGSQLIDKVVALGVPIGILHPVVELMNQYLQ